MTKHLVSALLGAAVLSLGHTPAFAAENGETAQVRFADLNIATPEGAKTMLRRIRAAAESVCGEPGPVYDLALQDQYANCVKSTMTQAVSRLNAPLVTLAYQNRHSPVAVAQNGR